MKIIFDNRITIREPSQEFKRFQKESLILKNPRFQKNKSMGYSTYGISEEIYLFQNDGTDVIIPYGLAKKVKGMTKNYEIRIPKYPNVLGYLPDFRLYDYQEKAVDKMIKEVCGILQAPAGSGKEVDVNTLIATPNGWKKIGDAKIGDKIFTQNGNVTKILGVFPQGLKPCYKITFRDNFSCYAGLEHQWKILGRNNSSKIMTTKDIIEKGVLSSSGQMKYKIPLCEPVRYKKQDLYINPYLLGCLIGDGYLCGERVTLNFGRQDEIILKNIKFPSGYKFGKKKIVNNSGSISIVSSDQKYKNEVIAEIKKLGLNVKSEKKFIPKKYLTASIEQRKELLRGLMDIDGSCSNNRTSFSTTSKNLANDISELIQSLGGVAIIRKSERVDKGTEYSVNCKVNFNPFKLKRKADKWSPTTKNPPSRYIKSIEYVDDREQICISVEHESELFLIENYIVTHNTQIGLAIACKLGLKTLWVTHTKDLLMQSKERAERYIDKSLIGTITGGKVNIGKFITFATVQTLSRQDLLHMKNTFGCVIVDECHKCCTSDKSVTQFEKVLSHLSCWHKYGLTATVHRADGLIKATLAILGDVAHVIPKEEVADKIMKVKVKKIELDTEMNWDWLDTDGTMVYSKLISGICDDVKRNNVIVNNIVANKSNYNLILSDRVSQLHVIMQELKFHSVPALVVDGKTKKELREFAFNEVRKGRTHVLLCTYALAQEGLDIPILNRLHLVTPQSDYKVINQSCGRIARTHPNKQTPICYDYVDMKIGTLEKKYKKRCTTYKKLDYEYTK